MLLRIVSALRELYKIPTRPYVSLFCTLVSLVAHLSDIDKSTYAGWQYTLVSKLVNTLN